MTNPQAASPEPLQIIQALTADRGRYLAFVRRRVRSDAAAEDVLQLGLTRAFERAGTLREMGALQGWFFRILRNVIVDQARKNSTDQSAQAGLVLEAEQFSEAVDRSIRSCECVGEAKDALRPEYAQILEGVEVEGIPVKAFAEQHGISASAAGVRVHRARKALLEEVQKTCGACASEGCMDCTCQREQSGCTH